MADKLIPVALPPGLFKNGTRHQAAGRWYDANLVRFFDNTIRPVGGWQRLQSDTANDFAALVGTPRAALAWRTDDAGVIQVVGTTNKLYAIQGGELRDITPVGFVTGRVDTGYGAAAGAYSAGPYGSGKYGSGAQTVQLVLADTWQLAPFGNSLAMVCTSDGKLRVWAGDPAVLPAVPAGAPAIASGVVATPERFLFVLGAGGNARVVQWPSQETTTDWVPSAINTAGDFELATNGALICGRASRGQTLLWTDCDLHAASYIGGTLVYRFARVGENCGIVSPNALAMLDGQALWMGRNGFFRYDGYVRPVECEVQDYVFGDFNYTQAEKCWAVLNAQYGEVWFYYVSAGSTEVDRYVIYNYLENHWSVGKLQRTAGYDVGPVPHPVWLDASGTMYEHEYLNERYVSIPLLADGSVLGDGSEIADGERARIGAVPYIESGPMEIGDGDRLMRIQRVVPDALTLADINLELYAANDPTSPETLYGPYSLAQPTNVQITARQVRLRLEETRQTDWRAGPLKLGVRQSSRR